MNRKGFIEYFLDQISKLLVNKSVREKNIELIGTFLNSMNDKQFDVFVDQLESGEKVIPIIVPNGSGGLVYENTMKRLDALNVDIFKHVVQVDVDSKVASTIKARVLELPVRKLIQLLDSKRSIPKDQNNRNILTGQVTNSSKSMSLTAPEIPLMLANGMYESIKELTIYRGGDEGSRRAIEELASRGMKIDSNILKNYSTGTQVLKTIDQTLLGMHIEMEKK